MNNIFEKIEPEKLSENPFKLIGKDWMLITAGNKEKFNTMTASWGTVGILWNKPIAITFIRNHRFTYEFIEREELFTLSFFSNEHKDILHYCGTISGRDADKISETGLKPLYSVDGAIGYEQAKIVLECKKIYFNDLESDNFLDKSIQDLYPNKDYHRAYIGEIKNCYVKKSNLI